MNKKVLLIILDGVGCNPDKTHNALAQAQIPYLSRLWKESPHTTLLAHGKAVGLPEGQMGSSETGHSIIGSGKVALHNLVAINNAIKEKALGDNKALLDAFAKAKNGVIHFCGLVSDGGVHSHMNHLFHLIALANQAGLRSVIHAITDGRDTAPNSGLSFLKQLDMVCKKHNAVIGSVAGRYYTMDRDKRWERIEKGLQVLNGSGSLRFESWKEGMEVSYNNNVGDEFIEPFIVNGTESLDKDSVLLFFNFRSDRMRQIAEHLSDSCQEQHIVTMTEYNEKFTFPTLFVPQPTGVCLGGIISDHGMSQLRCAESEKFAHVTYFFNNGRDEPFKNEERIIVDSPKVASYDLKPEMNALEVSEAITSALGCGEHSLIVVNYANGDMVGHTAIQPAILKAVECIDQQLTRVVETARAKGYSTIITADHGNCDEMVDSVTNLPHTQHSLHPVPFILVDKDISALSGDGDQDLGLSSIAPTICELMGIAIPDEMDGRSLIS